MAGDIFSKERAIVSLETNGASIATTAFSAAATTNLDCRSGGNIPEDFLVSFELACGFGTNPAANDPISLYLVPALDGTNFADIDTANKVAQADHFVDTFFVNKVQTTTQRLTVSGKRLLPHLYKAYLSNGSGVTLSTGWTLKAVGVRDQYT